MANSAPYEVNVSFSDDEAFAFCISFAMADETDFPFEDYAVEYSVRREGSDRISLTEDNGISISAPVVIFDAGNSPLRKGEYNHGCRIRHLTTGNIYQVFTGSVTIGEGEF